MMIGLMPLFCHYFFDAINGLHVENINYYPEIYIFNCIIFVYNFMNLYNKMPLFNNVINLTLILGVFVTFIISTIIYMESYYIDYDYILKIRILIFLIVLVLLNLIFTLILTMIFCVKDTEGHYSKNRDEEYSENRYERYLLERIDEKLNSIKNQKVEKNEEERNDTKNSEELINGSDILAEMLRNHIEIKEYFKISKNQSKFSFYFSIVSSVVGIMVVIIAASGIIVFKNLEISIIAAVSGAITEIISGVVLWIHNKSVLQLNYYYDSLHENEKFLSAVNIADKLGEEKKEDMYIEIIRKQINIQSKDKENKTSDIGKE